MGIDTHGFNFLRFAQGFGPLGKTVTLGRQWVALNAAAQTRLLGLKDESQAYTGFCENMLKQHFGATAVDSLDVSAYEGASILQDMNQPLGADLASRFDTVIEYGTIEHVFDIAQALRNVARLCKAPGGQILHAQIANNFCGHGFWQLSPELFYSLYSPENGFADTEIFLAELGNSARWYRIRRPPPGQRLNIMSEDRLYVLVRTVRAELRDTFSVFQSDYVSQWQSGKNEEGFKPWLNMAQQATAPGPWQSAGLKHPNLEAVPVAPLIAKVRMKPGSASDQVPPPTVAPGTPSG